jgi:preprotein translocase subunit SecA
MSFLKKIGFLSTSRHEKAAERYQPTVRQINALESEIKQLSDGELKQRILTLKGQDRSAIEAAVPAIFAVVREAARRTIKMRHFDVQLTGGLALLKDNIAEMKTGEGKTLVATLPMTVNALVGQGAHLITVNDYLAGRDAEWMGPVYQFLGLSVGVIRSGGSPADKHQAYAADITYGTNNEFGFDYLRDNMAQSLDQMAQRDLYYALIDEVDSILIDEARTPLIISAPDTESTQLYEQFAHLVPALHEGEHYNIDEKRRAATLNDQGISTIESRLGIDNIYAEKGVRFVHHLEQALRAQTLFHRDKDYVVQDGQVVIVDEFTGRLMPGRRYAEGLHQALEAKERVKVQQESRTLASITFQNYFRLYKHLGGMTGTAVTSAEEFEKVYNLDVVAIPTHQPMIREDKPDRIYTSEKVKFQALVEEIKQRHARGQPVLVGTIAIEKSERLSAMLQKEGIAHEVLNAKHHAREAEIISRAGERKAVTISTNMAGRGTDIKLGQGVTDLGGLVVFGTERHEARRIDNQLRGRSGRQGDAGESRFFVSLEDDVMRIFGGDRIKRLMERLKLSENEAIEHKLVSRAIASAQERVEGHYFDMRKQVLAYDDVLNRQRNAIYTLRRSLLKDRTWKEPGEQAVVLSDRITELVKQQAQLLVATHTGEGDPSNWSVEEIAESTQALTGLPVADIRSQLEAKLNETASEGPAAAQQGISSLVAQLMHERLTAKKDAIGEDIMRRLELAAALRAIDIHWMEHLDTMDYLRTGIGLRGYGQRDPLVEYQKEGHRLFQQLLATIKTSLLDVIFRAEAVRQGEERAEGVAHHQDTTAPYRIADNVKVDTQLGSDQPSTPALAAAPAASQNSGQPIHNPYRDVGRNDPCPCGAINPATGQVYKYKKCGLIQASHHKQ